MALPTRPCGNCQEPIRATFEHFIPNLGWSCHYVAPARDDPTPGTAAYFAWRLGYGSPEKALNYIGWATEHTDWGRPGSPQEREKWHERTQLRFLLALIKERDNDG